MNDLVRFLEQGNLSALIILGLTLALGWAVKQWRQAEADKDRLHEARLVDAKEMSVLAAELKNSVTTLIKIAGER